MSEHTEVDFVQLQLNYLDWENEIIQSHKCYETAKRHGKPVIVMEPVKGGTLVGCGQCEKMCPQHLPVREWLKQVAERFEGSFLR